MKKATFKIFAFLLGVFILQACYDDSISEGYFLSDGPAAAELQYYKKNVGESANNFTVNVTSNVEWKVKSSASWLSVTREKNSAVKVAVEKNNSLRERTATVIIEAAIGDKMLSKLTVNQSCDYSASTGTANGHGYVDLGLPSGVLWANCNVGATAPEGYGGHYAWGEVQEKGTCTWDTYKWFDASNSTVLKYCTADSYGRVDGDNLLDPEDDVASVEWGAHWRMPTGKEQDELREKCTWEWITNNGVNGYRVKGPNGNCIFLPAAGDRNGATINEVGVSSNYYSKSLSTERSDASYGLGFNKEFYAKYICGRFLGLSVRPVLPSCSTRDGYLTIERNDTLVEIDSTAFAIGVDANIEWTAQCDALWLKIEKQRERLFVTVKENCGSTERSEKIVFKCADCGEELANLTVKLKEAKQSGTQLPEVQLPEGNCAFEINGVTFEMINVKGSTFPMGATSEQQNSNDDEKPVHSVTLSDYYIGETVVSQALWQAVMGSNPSDFNGENNPVEQVSYDDCITFIDQLNTLLANQLPAGRKFRLPTEAEWEYAARGGSQSKGYQYSGSNTLDDVAWYYDNSDSKTYPVKQKQPNELGIYDMNGNVYEWCSDWYGSYSSSSETNPTGPSSGYNRVIRGGGWPCIARLCRVASRSAYLPGNRNNLCGLRLAL